MDRAGLRNSKIQRYGVAANNEELIDLDVRETSEQALDQGKLKIINALRDQSPAPAGKIDLNNASFSDDQKLLDGQGPAAPGLRRGSEIRRPGAGHPRLSRKFQSGVLNSMDQLKGAAGVDPAVAASIPDGFYLSDFGIRDVEIIGPQVGGQLRTQAGLATLYSLLGMLVYLGFRFEWIYGVAAVVTVFHDTLITVGAFSLTNTDITLTVIAAILTLIGYSNNDTIVVFDRIRENIKLMRREKLSDIVNRSINQTLSRTILTAGLTFLTVLALFLFGGEVLRGFSLALVIGILIGTYSSIAIAAPILVAYQDWRIEKGKRPVAMPGKAR